MARRRRYGRRRRRRRRSYKKRSRARKNRMYKSPSNQTSLVPLQYTTSLKYSATFNLNPGVGAVAAKNFSANSIFQPDPAGGHQPMGRDQYANLYGRYKVNYSTIQVTSPGVVEPCVLGVYSDRSGVFQGGFDGIVERPGSRWTLMRAGQQSVGRVKARQNVARMAQVGRNDDTIQASMGSNPAIVTHFWVWCRGMNAAVDVAAVDIQVVITYNVTFLDPINVAES